MVSVYHVWELELNKIIMSYLIRTKFKKRSNPNTIFVGGYVPLQICNDLTVFCTANSTSRNSLIEKILSEWLDNNFTKEVENNCLMQISKNMWSMYKSLEATRRCLSYKTFINELIDELKEKHLLNPSIKKILNNLDTIYENNLPKENKNGND